MRAALDAVEPSTLVQRALAGAPGAALTSFDRYLACAAGKASAGMLEAFRAWAGPRLAEAISSTGSHPFPDAQSVAAAEQACELAARTDRRTCLVLLISGGASAMLARPAAGVSLADKIEVSRALLDGGFAIGEMNCVRKHLSAVKGGWLAARAAACCTLAISDVIGPHEDDVAVIGSGPGVADPSTFGEATAILKGGRVWGGMPASVRGRIERGNRGELEETPKPGDPRLTRASTFVVGSRREAMAAALAAARALGYAAVVQEEPVLGEASHAGPELVRRATRLWESAGRYCVVSSGETTVTVRGGGRGGRNQELALAALPALAAAQGLTVLASVGTDGRDGPTDAAGAIVDSTSGMRAAALGLSPDAALAANDSHSFLDRLGDVLRTGPTGTNVGDLQVIVGVRPKRGKAT